MRALPLATLCLPALLAALFGAAAVSAQAAPVVVVHVRGHGDGDGETTVVLRDENGVVGTCTTRGRSCQIRGAHAGQHSVSTRDRNGAESEGRPVMMPASGKVTLFVPAR